MENKQRPLGLWFAWFITKLSPFGLLTLLAVLVPLAWSSDRRYGLLYGIIGLLLLVYAFVRSWKFAYVRADEAGLYVQRLWARHFVPWHRIESFRFYVYWHPCLIIRLKEPLAGTRDVLIDSVPPFNPSVGLWVGMALNRAEPEVVTWFRKQVAAAQNNGAPVAG